MKFRRKARKIYKCDTCEGNIEKGEIYEDTRLRLPKFDEGGIDQIGIEYVLFKMCKSCIDKTEQEQKERGEFMESDEYKRGEAMWEHRYP